MYAVTVTKVTASDMVDHRVTTSPVYSQWW